MNPVKEFEKRFENEITDMLVLIKSSASGAAVVGDMLRPSVNFIASKNTQTGEFSQETGRLEWMISKETKQSGWGYNFKQFQICHIRARKNIPISLTPSMLKTMNNCYMVVEVLAEDVSDPQLEAVREHVAKPLAIEDPVLGTFVLDREFSWFKGAIDWLGTKCIVYLETDEEDGETAGNAFAHLQVFYQNLGEWDEKFRLFAAKSLLEMANEWYEEGDSFDEDASNDHDKDDEDEIHITKEEFLRRISAESITITADGDLTLYYDADEMFTDHAIEIDADMSGEISSAYLVG